MKSTIKLLQSHLWLAFLLHQSLIFAFAYFFLTSVRRLTGRTIHGGRDPLGLVDSLAMIALSVLVILLTVMLYRQLIGKDATPLGIELSPHRFIELIIGALVGFAFFILPWIISLSTGTAVINDRISAYFDNFSIMRIISLAIFLLLVQSVTEETANRAFPMRLWEHRSVAFRILVPSLFFAAIHLADEELSIERMGILIMGGIVQGLAYLLTGNIWFTSGLHTGANLAAFSMSGLWHAGAVARVVGRPAYPNWVAVMIMLGTMSVANIVLGRYKTKQRLRATDTV